MSERVGSGPLIANWCLDGKRPVPLGSPHGHWWLTVWIPIWPHRSLYVGLGLDRWAARPHFVRVSIPKSRRNFWHRVDVRMHRWCGHVHIREVSSAAPVSESQQ